MSPPGPAAARPGDPPRPPSALDRFVRAFKRDCLNATPYGLDHYVELFQRDQSSFMAEYFAAWGARRCGPYAHLYRVLDMNGVLLSNRAARRIVSLLLVSGRSGDAVEVLQDPRFDLLSDADGQLALAQGAIGIGQPDVALEALARASQLDASAAPSAQVLDKALRSAVRGQRQAEASGRWPDSRDVVNRWLELGSPTAAASALRAFVASGALKPREYADFHHALDTIVSLHPAEGLTDLFRAMARLYPGEAERLDLELICAGLRGKADPAEAPAWRSTGRDLRASGALAWAQAGMHAPAILALGALSQEFPRDIGVRAGLARTVGRDVLSSHHFRLQPRPGPPKVFDVFLFNDELRMLQIKLHEMSDWVDRFVLVEARQTFRGAPKPLVFEQNKSQFARFASKIVHVVVDAFPDHVRTPWAREFYQRDMGLVGLNGLCREDDLVIISDTDEIVWRDAVKEYPGDYARLAMERARFFLNYREALTADTQKEASSLWRAFYLPSLGLNYPRTVLRSDKKAPRLSGCGWHFTSIADSHGVAAKMTNSAHQEYSALTESHYAQVLGKIRAGELDEGWERCELDERFPAYIRDHRDEFEDVLL